jgi:hypothetical protein
VRGNLFLFPPVLEDASTFVGLGKRSFGSKTTPRKEAIQLYRIMRRELEHKISTTCSVSFGDKDWGWGCWVVPVGFVWVDYVGVCWV